MDVNTGGLLKGKTFGKKLLVTFADILGVCVCLSV